MVSVHLQIYSLSLKYPISFLAPILGNGYYIFFRTYSFKIVEAWEAKDYHPISVVHSFTKLVTKLMANLLAPLLGSMVATNKNAS